MADRHLVDVHVILASQASVLLTDAVIATLTSTDSGTCHRANSTPANRWSTPPCARWRKKSAYSSTRTNCATSTRCTSTAADPNHGSGVFFEAQHWLGDPVNREPEKCSAVRWFSLDDLPANLIAYPAAGINAYINGQAFGTLGWTGEPLATLV